MWTKSWPSPSSTLNRHRPDALTTGQCLAGLAIAALRQRDLDEKVRLTQKAAQLWGTRSLSLRSSVSLHPPERPGRPAKPVLLPPKNVPKRSLNSAKGRIALLHAIAHIELNAIDLALDIVARFAPEKMPRSFFDDWMRVASEEAKHFTLLRRRLAKLDVAYGDLPAHDGLWDAAQETSLDLTARLAIVPLVLEARGLDVTPAMIDKMTDLGDRDSAEIFKIIYEDEKGHVAVGAKWFRFLCQKQGLSPAPQFQELVKVHFRGHLRPPFNDRARASAGLTPTFYRALSSQGN